jgi:signal transduction histidine kinase
VSFPTTTVPIRVLNRRSYIERRPVTIQVARSEAAMRAELRELSLILVFGLPIGVVIAGLGGYTLARGALAPIEQMTERARTITAERLGDRLPVDNPDDEMGRLASVFNETLGRLEESFNQMRRFTADVSHELRTPLTAIRSVGEVGLRGHRTEASYRGIIGSMLEEVDRLAGLVDRLLALSRADTHQQARLALDVVDLAALADDVAGHLGVLAEEKGQAGRAGSSCECTWRGRTRPAAGCPHAVRAAAAKRSAPRSGGRTDPDESADRRPPARARRWSRQSRAHPRG